MWAPRVIKLGLCKEALILDWDIGVWAPKLIKLVLCWGGVGGCGELVWTGILGGRRGGGVLNLRCKHKKYKTGVMLGLFWGGVGGCRGLFWTGILGKRRGGGVRSELWAQEL